MDFFRHRRRKASGEKEGTEGEKERKQITVYRNMKKQSKENGSIRQLTLNL